MPKVIKYTLLNYIPSYFEKEQTVNPKRIFKFNTNPIKNGFVVYLCERELRLSDNFALQFALKKSNDLNLPLKIVSPDIICDYKPKQNFLNIQKPHFSDSALPKDIGLLVIDFNPILNRDYLKIFDFPIYEIDGHNIVPARFISDKQEYNAATLRRKIYHNIYPFLTEFENISNEKTNAHDVLNDFIQNKLPYYAEFKNYPDKNVLSNLSKYLNLGFISPQRVALEVIKSDVSEINKEVFLEELIVRRELADNFCLYSKNYKNFSGIPTWAKVSLDNHKFDLRTYIYSLKEFENSQTHDKLWNATQNQLRKEGIIHSYLRMYWAKMILQWSKSPNDALKTCIYLNDKYSYDSPSPNGYVGILWALGGLHDRAFADYSVTGKIRRMTYESIKRKFNIEDYIKKYETL